MRAFNFDFDAHSGVVFGFKFCAAPRLGRLATVTTYLQGPEKSGINKQGKNELNRAGARAHPMFEGHS